MKKILFIVNPYAGKRKIQTELLDVIKIFNEANYQVETSITLYDKHAVELAKNTDADLIVCSGGDGTMNQVVMGLIASGKDIPIGYIPAGSTNDFANTLNLSTNIQQCAYDIVQGQTTRIDIGQFDDSYFTYIASFGLFTSVSYNTPQSQKNNLGHLAYVLEGLKDLGNMKTEKVKIVANGKETKGEYIFGAILNTTSIGGILKIEKDVDLSDGLFEGVFVKEPKDLSAVNKIVNGISNSDFSDKTVFDYLKINKAQLHFETPLNWSLDGEKKIGAKIVGINILNKKVQIKKQEN